MNPRREGDSIIIFHVGINGLKSGQTPCDIAGEIQPLAMNWKSSKTESVISELVAIADSSFVHLF